MQLQDELDMDMLLVWRLWGTMRGCEGHGAPPVGLGSFALPSKAASAGAELVLGAGPAVQPPPSRG